jgi:hypothetical protein
MTYLGLWGLEKMTSKDQELSYGNLIAILGAFLSLATLCLGGYTWLYREVARNEPNKGLEDDDVHIKQLDALTHSAEDCMGTTEHTTPSGFHSNLIPQLDVSSHDDFNESLSDDIATRFAVNQQISRLSSQCEEMEVGDQVTDSTMVRLGPTHTPSCSRYTYLPILHSHLTANSRRTTQMQGVHIPLYCLFIPHGFQRLDINHGARLPQTFGR